MRSFVGNKNPNWQGGPIIVKCIICGTEKEINKGRLNYKRQFCGNECRMDWWKEYLAIKARQKSGEKSPNWKGEKVGFSGIHRWIRKRLLKPERCQDCAKKTEKLDLANISQEYKRDLTDWEWLCRKCHMTKDGRLEEFKKRSFKSAV